MIKLLLLTITDKKQTFPLIQYCDLRNVQNVCYQILCLYQSNIYVNRKISCIICTVFFDWISPIKHITFLYYCWIISCTIRILCCLLKYCYEIAEHNYYTPPPLKIHIQDFLACQKEWIYSWVLRSIISHYWLHQSSNYPFFIQKY